MAGNTTKIDDIVSKEAFDQLDLLTTKLAAAQQGFVDTAKGVVNLNNAIANSNAKTLPAIVDNATEAMAGLTKAEAEIIKTTKSVDDILVKYGGTTRDIVKLLVDQRTELSGVNDQLKLLNKTEAVSSSGKVEQRNKIVDLVQKQSELKTAIRATNTELTQSIKTEQAAKTSQTEQEAQLARLRILYKGLSEEERNNAQVGGVLLASITQLDAKTKEADASQGLYNKSVGDYENAIKRAIQQYVPYGNQIVKAVDTVNKLTTETGSATTQVAGLGARFASFTIGAFAVGIASATYYLQQFRNTGQEVEQFTGGLKNQFANLGKNFIDIFKGKKPPNGIWTGFVTSFNQGVDVTKMQQDVKNMNEVNDQQIQIMQAQADRFRAQARNVGESAAWRADQLKKAQSIENKIVAQQKDNAKDNINAAIELGQKGGSRKLLPSELDLLRGGDNQDFGTAAQYANDIAQRGIITEAGYEAIMTAYQRQTSALQAANMKLIRQQNDEARIGLKAAKEVNNDELELQKAKLESEKEAARLILDDNKQSYEARIAALKIFVSRSNAIIGTEENIANRTPGITKAKRGVNAQNANNQRAQVGIFDLNEQKKLQEEQNQLAKEQDKRNYESKIAAERAYIEYVENQANEQTLKSTTEATKQTTALTNEYEARKITAQQYQDGINKINQQAADEALQIEIDKTKNIIKIQAAAIAIGGGDPKALQGSANRLAGLENQQANNRNKAIAINAQSTASLAQKAADIEIRAANEAAKAVQSVVDGAYEAKIISLQKQSQLISENAEIERAAIEQSLDTQTNKQRRESILAAQTAAQQKEIQRAENKAKHDQAIADKAFNVAAVVENTIVEASKVGSQLGIFGIPLEAIVIAEGVARVAAILAQPIPAFAKGVTNFAGGPAIVGERGSEIIETRHGSFLSPATATLMQLPGGTNVIPHHQVSPEVLREVKPNQPIIFDSKGIIKAINDKQAPKQRNDHAAIARAISQAAYQERRFR